MANLETSITIALKIDIPESYPAGAMDEWIPVYSLLQEERQIAKGNLLTTIPSLAKEWYLSFQFKANKIDKGFRQVLHMTTGGKGAGSGAKGRGQLKKIVFFRALPELWGGVYPCPNFLEVHFWSIKEYFFKNANVLNF